MKICLKVKSVTNPINIWKNQANLIVQLLDIFWVPTILVSQNASSLLLWCNYVSFLSCWSSQSNISSTKLTTGQISPGLHDGTFLARQVEVWDSDLEDTEGSIWRGEGSQRLEWWESIVKIHTAQTVSLIIAIYYELHSTAITFFKSKFS